ncbi:SpaA isopeptide-forming pilin-related protein [Anaerococcus rubeinfantis]|uniref:SpaA isopeptide-forming pilin-related protein n=1 Tax=Anaerococcus rubeinfantis TaxID=1720199 RepID=UPI00073F9C70|nr:SpaA isopeptide-forming pilin-related protein [Anaerococcus rubeinfantis]
MKKLARKMMSLLMAVFMVLQVILPAFATSSKAEDENPNSIKSVDKLEDDPDLDLSIKKSQEIYDKKKVEKDQDKFTIAVSIPDTNSKFRLVKRNDLKLFDDNYFETNEKASKEYWRVKDMLNDQGLDLDLEIIEDENGFKLITKEELEKDTENQTENPYGENYSYIDFKIMDDFDFNEKGNQKLLDEDKLIFNLEFLQYESLDPEYNLYEKDQEGNLKIKNQGDIFALIVDDKKSLYDTKKLEEDYNNLKLYKEEKLQKEADQKAQKEAEEKDKKETEEKQKEEEAKKAQEEKAKAEKSSSNKEEQSENSKEESNKEKESKTEIKVESNETSNETSNKEKEEKTDSNKEEKDSTKEETKTQEKKEDTNKQENKKETETQTNKTKENSQAKTQEKSEEKKEEKQGLMPKLRMLFLGQPEPAKALKSAPTNSTLNLDGKKFTINTRFDTSTAVGPIKAGQYFIIHLDEKLTVNDENSLEPIKYNGKIIATPKYNNDNTITYTIKEDINENINVPLSIPVDYNTEKIKLDKDGTFTVTNKVSGLGVKAPKDLVPQKIDKNGNPAGSIIEPGRKDITQIVDSSKNYRLDIDSVGNPVIENGEMVGINWVVKIESDKDLKNDLGMKMNFTLVEGSGLKEIESITSSDATEDIQNNDAIKGKTGIVDSKHSTINQSTKSYMYTIYTPISNRQADYVLDISTILTKDLTNGQPYVGAVRSVMDKGYPKDKVEQDTPTRVGINNRTTIEGKFLSNTKAQWTITDGVCTLDKNNGLPLETRTLKGANINSGKRVVYGVDTATGMMVVKEQEKGLTSIPDKETDPDTSQAVGNIGVYQFTHDVDESTTPNSYTMAGVKISKFQDLYIDQEWNLPVEGMTMPAQTFIAKDDAGKQIAEKHVDAGAEGENQRLVVVPNARYWNIADDGTANKVGHKISQKFDSPPVTQGGKTYKYNENANYYQIDTKRQYIHNSAIDTTKPKPVTFTVVKVDSKDPSKKLAGARFKLLGDNQLSIVTDDQGKATFNNVLPRTYTLIEEKAPDGYKLDQSQKTITVAEDGTISVDGGNIQLSGGKNVTKLVQHDSAPNWPDYMNAMHYGKINDNGEVEFYLYLKPESNNGGDGTNRDTRLNISIPGVDITDVTAYDVSPGYRNTVKYSMEQQNIDGYIPLLGDNVIDAANNNKITGTSNKTDPYTGKTGYQIYFPQKRFENDWGFLVKVKANIGDKQSVSLDYDWLTDKDTAGQTKLTQNVIINKASGEAGENQILVTNEEFTKSPISITKFGDEFDNDGNRNKLKGAEFVLKDSKGNVIANKFTDKNGTADFGKYPPGTYRLEEAQAPDGYQKNGVYFEVVVDDQGQVTYTARFEDGIGTPEVGHDYYIEKGEETDTSKKAKVTNVNQRLEYLENEPGDIGVKTGVWEAYKFESLKYHADITLSDSAPGTRFEIQFDRNLDFTQYFSDFPKIVIDGVEVADPYFDYDTNLLTYVFNDKSKGGPATASINLRGIIPDKYYATESKTYPFTIKVAPGVDGVGGNPVLTEKINADYGPYDSGTRNSNQFYYFRDVYQKEDGEWYVTVMAYLNPMGFNYGSKTSSFNWITTDFQSDQQIARWSGKGYDPLYTLQDVKVYGTDFAAYRENEVWKNPYMPPSFGVRPEQDPNIYHLLAHQRINPTQKLYIRENDVTINYDPKEIKTSGRIDLNHPLKITTPSPRDKGGYIIEQTYKITDIDQFNKKWRAFHMTDGNLESAFASKANVNTAIGDQAGGEIPKYYKEIIGLINNKYTPGSFKLTKYDETNQEKKLPNATFALTDENGKVIYRTSNSKGEVDFTNIAPGRYSLEETKAPDGYRLTNKKWQVTVLSDGSVRIRETSITGESKLYTGNEIKIPVANKPVGQKFRVYKKDGKGQPLPGAKFKITDPDDSTFSAEATSRPDGIVEFDATLVEGKNYILQEVTPPTGYNPLNKKWVLRVEDGKTKVYNYSENTEIGEVEKSLIGEEGTEWVDVKNRNTSGWSDYDNRWTGWAANSKDAKHLGTRIIAINKKEKYVVQRYIINPEAKQTVGVDGITAATIHREKPEYPNMDWYKGDEDIKIFTLEAKEGGNTDGKVTGLISDLRLAAYEVTEITDTVKKTTDNSHHGETRLKLDLPATNKPIVVDVKVPYKDENGGVGTGMDWREGNTTYWKSDYYERVSDIKTAGLVSSTGGTIVGSYVAEGSLDVTNNLKTYGFKIKKVKEDKTTPIPGAVFKLKGPGESPDERFMTTDKDGMISFNDLKPGTYTLVEEKPAPGYEKKTTTWTIRVAQDGKVYIKDNSKTANANNASFEVSTTEKSATNNLMRRLKMAGANTELEISGNLVDVLNPLRAESDWEVVDPARSNQPDNRSDSSNVKTKITQINKVDGKYRQIFLVNLDNRDMTYSKFDFHAQPPQSSIIGVGATKAPNESYNFRIVSIKSVTEDSTIDNIKYDGERFGFKEAKNTKSDSYKRFSVKLDTGYTKKTLAVEVEYTYPKSGPIGVGMDYYAYNGAPKQWAAEKYNGAGDINYTQLIKNYNLNILPSQNGSVKSEKTSDIEEKESITLEVKPIDGYELEQLKVDRKDVTKDVNNNQYTFEMPNHDVDVQASFKGKTYSVTYNVQNNGTVTANPKDNIKAGDTVTLTLNPIDGYILKSLEVNSGAGPVATTKVNDTTYTFKMPASDVGINVSYEKPQASTYNINVDENIQNGAISPSVNSATVGTQINLTVTPSEGYEIESVTKDGSPITADANGQYKFTMPASNVTVSATFKKTETPDQPGQGEVEIKPGEFAQITNKQTGLDLKIYKKDRYDRKLEGAIFTIRKTDENYENIDKDFGVKTGTSNAEGLVEFKDDKENIIKLPKGYYVIEETAAPLGYRKANAPWKVKVVEENGQLVAKYKGPKETPQSFIEKNENLGIKEANGVKYSTKITHIDTESRTFIQRVYIDTRGKQGTVNVQIKPKHKREEIDRAGLPPVTITEGVKTAYRSTYKITGLDGDPNEAQMIKILNDYDISNPDVTVVNTARWRPFDWGFDEDQLNLEPGVYYIDIEGFYDTSIIDRNVTNEVAIDKNYNFTQKDGVTPSDEPVLKDSYKLTAEQMPDEDLGKIDIDIQFFDGAREFQQLKNSNGKIVYGVVKDENGKDEASYQDGVVTLRQWLEDNYGKNYADNWFKTKLPGQKYVNQLSKIVKIGKKDVYQSGRIIPPVTPGQQGYKAPFSKISTSMDISSLYSSNATNTVPQEGLSIENDAERYNITFSKHGKDTDKDSVEEITKRRLEGAVFKLEKRVREGIYEEVEGSYVSSAFNGYFGFRGLEPGRYRLIEVQAPKGYKPIDGPLLHFSVETVSIVSQRITDPRTGENINVKQVSFYFPGNDKAYKFEDLEMRDPTDNTKIIKFKDAKNADLETTKIIDPTDSTKKTEVSLRELSIKFPGEIKDKDGEVIKDTYKISEIQITPTSNGYISLEYDKANGVYQYIPEKSSTEKDGLLVDYVTSATAKNMGKIVNEKPGEGEITVRKIDQNGNEIKATGQLAGAKFLLTNKSTGKTEEKTVGEDGTIKFTGLKIGQYRLEEVKSPDGYINNKQVWNFTVGGEGLDPYSGDAPEKTRDVSSSIKLSESKLSVLNPDSKNDGLLSDTQKEMHPHLGEVFEFDNKYTIDSNLKINPGDYFVLKLSENIDLHGIMETDISNLDIIADGVGTIAKADYNREKGTITYTFTRFAETYNLVEFSNKLKAYINLNKVPKEGLQSIERGVVGHEMKTDNINVVYDSMTAREKYQATDGNMYEMTQNHLNLGSKIIKYNPDTGEFVHYYYVNRDRSYTPRSTFYYSSDKNIENMNIEYYKLDGSANLDELMPLSFGVNENDPRLPAPVQIRSRSYLGAGEKESISFTNGLNSNSSYIFKVTGRVMGEDKSSYVANGKLQMIDYPGRYVTRWDKQYFFANEADAKADLEIQAVNPANKIKFKKINDRNEALENAEFIIQSKDSEGEWNNYGQPAISDEDGLFEFTKLPKGEYRLLETEAPEGYEKPTEALVEFKVDDKGVIYRLIPIRDENGKIKKDENGKAITTEVEEPGIIPIDIVNTITKEIEFKKVDGEDNSKVLAGAEFEVWFKKAKDEKYSKDILKLYEKTNSDKTTERLVLKAEETPPEGFTEVTKFVTGEDGKIKFKFKEPGYYALKEVKAPAGYIKPRGIVKEFALLDGKVQTEQYKTEMDVKKTTDFSMANDVFKKSYTTNMTLRFNPNHEEITYVKDKSTIKLSDLPLKSEIWDNSYNRKQPISITAYLVDGDNKETTTKTYNLDLTKDYNSGTKASKTINLYSLVKELEKQTTDGDIKSNKTIVLKMSTSLYLTSELDIKSNIVIGDKINEDRTFHIGTKGDDYVDHSYKFTTSEEISKDKGTNAYTPIQIENKKLSLPMTSGLRAWIGFTIIGLILMLLAAYYYNKKKNKGLDLEKNS